MRRCLRSQVCRNRLRLLIATCRSALIHNSRRAQSIHPTCMTACRSSSKRRTGTCG
jgi:hypothetical protein